MQCTPRQTHLEAATDGESDTDIRVSPLGLQYDTPQPELLHQFKQMLTKALKHTSDAITEELTREIFKLGQRTSKLDHRKDNLHILTRNHTEELEDFENRVRRSNLETCGIPETVTDLQSTITTLFHHRYHLSTLRWIEYTEP